MGFGYLAILRKPAQMRHGVVFQKRHMAHGQRLTGGNAHVTLRLPRRNGKVFGHPRQELAVRERCFYMQKQFACPFRVFDRLPGVCNSLGVFHVDFRCCV